MCLKHLRRSNQFIWKISGRRIPVKIFVKFQIFLQFKQFSPSHSINFFFLRNRFQFFYDSNWKPLLPPRHRQKRENLEQFRDLCKFNFTFIEREKRESYGEIITLAYCQRLKVVEIYESDIIANNLSQLFETTKWKTIERYAFPRARMMIYRF